MLWTAKLQVAQGLKWPPERVQGLGFYATGVLPFQ
jgi:hypothetical protein